MFFPAHPVMYTSDATPTIITIIGGHHHHFLLLLLHHYHHQLLHTIASSHASMSLTCDSAFIFSFSASSSLPLAVTSVAYGAMTLRPSSRTPTRHTSHVTTCQTTHVTRCKLRNLAPMCLLRRHGCSGWSQRRRCWQRWRGLRRFDT